MYIASIAAEVKLHMWPSGQLVNTYKTNGNGVLRTISWGKDGKWLVVVPSQGHAEIIGVRDKVLKHLSSLDSIAQPTCAVFQNLTKRNIALGTTTGNVLIYDIKHKSIKYLSPRAKSTVFQLEYSVNDNYLFAGCEDGEIMAYNSSTANCSSSYRIPNSKTLSTLRTHPSKRNLLMAGCEEGLVAVWDCYRTNRIHKHQTHQAIVTDVAFSPRRNDLIVSCGLDRKFVFWDIASNGMVLQQFLDRSPTAIDFCPDGVGLAIGTQSGTIYTYDTRQMNTPTYIFKAHNSFIKQIMFQKILDADETCDYTINQNITEESGEVFKIKPEIGSVQEFPDDKVCDSFGHMLHDAEENVSNFDQKFENDAPQDSFLAAMGINQDSVSSYSSPGPDRAGPISKGVRKLLDSNPNLLDLVDGQQTQASPVFLKDNSPKLNQQSYHNIPERRFSETHQEQHQHETPSASTLKHRQISRLSNPGERRKLSTGGHEVPQKNSTPKIPSESLGDGPCITHMSPIISQSSRVLSDSEKSEIQNIVKNIVKQEVKEQLDVIRQEVKEQFEIFYQKLKFDNMDGLMLIRNNFLDLKMCVVKESIQLEKNINKFHEDLRRDD
ncbi:uncharacterized protein [Onthophagus taurus]|uniref:uncharacterized protein n=1 Tax=Onthophagus taurus TaxID=166361 RepID=UPI0039BE20AF